MEPVADVVIEPASRESTGHPISDSQSAACPACGQQQALPIWPGASANGFSIVRCTACQLAYTVPQLSIEKMAVYYSQAYYGAGNLRFNRLFETLVGWFRRRRASRLHKLHGHSGSVLDIGCGRGHFLQTLKTWGWSCTGTELTETAARHARDRLGLDVRIGPFVGAMFPDETFDAVYLWHVLEHIPATAAALTDAGRLLRPGGMLVVALPNLESWQARLCRYHWFHLDLPRHYVHCSASWLIKTLSALGFRIVEVNHFSAEQNVYGWIQSVLNGIGLKQNLLYDLLRRPTARDVDRPWAKYPIQSVVSLVAGVALLPLASAAMLAEAMFHRGGTVEVYAEKA